MNTSLTAHSPLPALRRVGLLLALALGGCAAAPAAPEAPPSTVRGAVSSTVTVSGAVDKRLTLDEAALKAFPPVRVTVGGHGYVGASLWTVLNSTVIRSAAKNPSVGLVVVATGSDGYRALVALAEIDPTFGNSAVIVAYEMDGAPLGRSGMARLIVAKDVKMGRAVSNLVAIEVMAVP